MHGWAFMVTACLRMEARSCRMACGCGLTTIAHSTSFISRCCRKIFRMNSSGRIGGSLAISSRTYAAVTGPLATSNEMSKLKPDAVSSNLMIGTLAFATTCMHVIKMVCLMLCKQGHQE